MLPNFKAYLTCALCVLSTLCLTAAGDRDNSDDNPAIHPRSDTVPWSSHRTLTLGIGPQGQNIGTQTRWSDKDNSYFLHDNIKNAIDKLCKKDGFGFDQCDGEDEYRVSVVAVKDKDGNMVRDGVFKVKVGSSYWPYGHGGLREVLRDAAAWTMQTVAENNCWKPGFNGKEQDTEICMAPDKIMLRVDDLAWLVVFLFQDPPPVPLNPPYGVGIRVCPATNFYTGETQTKLEDKMKDLIKKEEWYKAVGLDNEGSLGVKTKCHYGTEPEGEGDGWCRDRKGYKGHC